VEREPADRESAEDATTVDASVETEGSGPGDQADADEVSEAPDTASEEAGSSDEPVSDEPVSDEAAADEPVSDEAAADEPEAREPADASASDDTEPDDTEPDEQAPVEAGAAAAEDVPGEPGPAEAASPAGRARRLRPYLRRGAVALVAAGFVALGVGAFAWVAPSPEGANQRFVEAAQSQGHVVAPGAQETLVISAARKICDRRATHDTDQERRATALNSDEIAAVGTAFGADTRDFTTLALETFCSS
jgi:hypothetical protein